MTNMRTAKLHDMKKGWFVGNFEPAAFKTGNAEVAVKKYKAGDSEKKHFHRIATEITVVVSGEVEMNNNRYRAGDIVIIEPSEAADFKTIYDAITVVVKVPGAKNDKYHFEENEE